MFSSLRMSKDIAVLESKFAMYEQLSKDMLDKLENAVEKISQSNANIATILAKHDARIEQGIKADEILLKMLEEFRENYKTENNSVETKIEKLETSVGELIKFRWLTVGIAVAAATIISSSSFFLNLLTPKKTSAIMGATVEIPHHHELS